MVNRTHVLSSVPPSSYHHGNLREALIEACLQALSEAPSSDGVSLRELARRVGVTANAAYRHFADKEDLLQAVAARGFRELATRSAHARGRHGADVVSGFRAAGQAYVDFARAHPALFRLMFGSKKGRETDSELGQAANLAFQGVLDLAAEVTGRPVDEARTLTAAVAAWSLVHGLAHLALDGQLQYFADDLDAMIETVLGQFRLTEDAAIQPARPSSSPRRLATAQTPPKRADKPETPRTGTARTSKVSRPPASKQKSKKA